jgi:hypothetical protein
VVWFSSYRDGKSQAIWLINMRLESLLVVKMVATTITFVGTPAKASQMSCHLSSLKDGSLLETLKIGLSQDNVWTIWHRWEPRPYSIEKEENEKVLFSKTTNKDPDPDSPKFSVVVIDQSSYVKETKKTLLFPPVVYYIDWGKVKLGQVTVGIDDKTYLDVRWECERLD